MVCMLAPVPGEHLETGLNVVQQFGKVAFGSQLIKEFHTWWREYGDELPVLIYASKSGAPSKIFVPGAPTVRWQARLVGVEIGDKLGRYPGGDQFRPMTTKDDRAASVFWVVRDLKPTQQPIPISKLRSATSGKLLASTPPLRPLLVEDVDDLER